MPRGCTLLTMAVALRSCAWGAASARTRVIVLTDIENEPDDAESIVRFLAYSNQ